jgi:hypothetical protein
MKRRSVEGLFQHPQAIALIEQISARPIASFSHSNASPVSTVCVPGGHFLRGRLPLTCQAEVLLTYDRITLHFGQLNIAVPAAQLENRTASVHFSSHSVFFFH